MILQDLIRNVVLYKGVVRPLLQSWIEPLLAHYSKQNCTFPYSRITLSAFEAKTSMLKADRDKQRQPNTTYFLVSDRTGTRTMSHLELEAKVKIVSSTNKSIVLVEGNIKKGIVRSGKTYSQTVFVDRKAVTEVMDKMNDSTTGSAFENICTYLYLETHGEREYLGEFSLTHEETYLIHQRKGGEHHGINKKPITAII